MGHSIYGEATRIAAARNPEVRQEPTRVIEVFMAGDIVHAKQVIRRFCRATPCCVTVTPTTFIYSGGEESGFVVGIRNYPRFPAEAEVLGTLADRLGSALTDELGQHSYMTVEHGGKTTWRSTGEQR